MSHRTTGSKSQSTSGKINLIDVLAEIDDVRKEIFDIALSAKKVVYIDSKRDEIRRKLDRIIELTRRTV